MSFCGLDFLYIDSAQHTQHHTLAALYMEPTSVSHEAQFVYIRKRNSKYKINK